MRKRIIKSLAVTAILIGLGLPAYAGWVEVDKHSGTTYISGGLIKNVPEDGNEMWTIMDVNKGIITMVNPGERSYTVVEPEKFCAQMSSMMGDMMEGIPPEQRAMMEQMMGRGGPKRTPKVAVAKKGNGGRIAGLSTVKYSVTVDGRPYKDIWLATSAPIMNDVRSFIEKAEDFSTKMESCTRMGSGPQGPDPEAAKEYKDLAEKGWTMKELNRESGEVETEVIRLEKKSIPASEFRVPSGYRKVEMKEMMGGMME